MKTFEKSGLRDLDRSPKSAYIFSVRFPYGRKTGDYRWRELSGTPRLTRAPLGASWLSGGSPIGPQFLPAARLATGAARRAAHGLPGSGTRDGKQHYEALGAADDARDADGLTVFSFSQAQEKAREFFERKARELAGHAEPADGRLTVADALYAYFADREQRGSKGLAKDRAAAQARILPELGRGRGRQAHDETYSRLAFRLGEGAQARSRPGKCDGQEVRASI